MIGRWAQLLALALVLLDGGQARLRHAAPPPGDKAMLTAADFTYLGVLPFQTDADAGNGANIGASRGTMTGRYVGNELRLFVTGNPVTSPTTDLVHEYAVTSEPNTDITMATPMPLRRKWGDVYEGRKLITTGEIGWTWGLYFEAATNVLWWTYSTNYAGEPWNPAIGATYLNDSTGAVTSYGPWRTAETSGYANADIFPVPTWFQAYTGGKTHFFTGSVHSQIDGSPGGATLYALNLPALSTPADLVYPDTHVSVPVQTLLHYTQANPQPRLEACTFKICAWNYGSAANHSTTTAAAAIGDKTLAVADTTHYADPTSFSRWGGVDSQGCGVANCYFGWVGADHGQSGTEHIDYTGKSVASGPGLLTGVNDVGGENGLLNTHASGSIVHYGDYDDSRGGNLDGVPTQFFGAGAPALSNDWIDHYAWIEGTTKYGLWATGQLANTVPGHDYGINPSAPDGDHITDNAFRYTLHRFYKASDGYCFHGQFSGPNISYMWLFNPQDLVDVATNTKDMLTVLPTVEVQSSTFGLNPLRAELRQYGSSWYDTTTCRLYMVELNIWRPFGDGQSHGYVPGVHVWHVNAGGC